MIQIDMEMPKNCLDCNLRHQSFCSVDGHHEPYLEKERCPLKVTPQEPIKGHWEHGKEINKVYRGQTLIGINYLEWHCSNCAYVVEQSIKPKWDYCPNCGAKMAEQEET